MLFVALSSRKKDVSLNRHSKRHLQAVTEYKNLD